MRAFWRAIILLMAGLLWLVLSALAHVPRVSIRHPGRVATAPAEWWIVVKTDPKPEDRWLVVEMDGQPGDYRRSDYAMEGERAPTIRQVWFKGINAGCYWFRASVLDTSKVLASVRSGPVSIIGSDGDSCPD